MPVCDLFREKECVEIEGNPLREALAEGLKSCGDARGINLQVNTWQVDVAATFLEGYDQMLVTATGTGKTLCFLMGLLSRQDKSVLVVSPLLSLMANQVEACDRLGIKSCALTAENVCEDPGMVGRVAEGAYQVIFIAPEFVSLENPQCVRILKSTSLRSRIIGLVVDEGHSVHNWKTFRPKYRQVGLLRLHFPGIPILVCSATMPTHVRAFVHASLKLARPTILVKRGIDCKNIYLCVHQIRQGIKSFRDLDFVPVAPVGAAVLDIPKTMIFIDDKDAACDMTTYLRGLVRKQDLLEYPDLISEYTTGISHKKRAHNLQLFLAGECRVMICTEACAMGVDIPDVQRVIQWTVPLTLNISTLWQRFGRCARSPHIQGIAILMVSSAQVVSNVFEKAAQIYWADAGDPTDEAKARAHQVLAEIRAFDIGKDVRQKVPQAKNQNKALRDAVGEVDFSLESGLAAPREKNAPHERQSLTETCRAICWFVNTQGCRRQTIMKYFDDAHWDSRPEASCCSNCEPPELIDDLKNLIPPGGFPKLILTKDTRSQRGTAKNPRKIPPAPEGKFIPMITMNTFRKHLITLRKDHWKGLGMQRTHIPSGDDFCFSSKEMESLVRNIWALQDHEVLDQLLTNPRPLGPEAHEDMVRNIQNCAVFILELYPPQKKPTKKNTTVFRTLLGVGESNSSPSTLMPNAPIFQANIYTNEADSDPHREVNQRDPLQDITQLLSTHNQLDSSQDPSPVPNTRKRDTPHADNETPHPEPAKKRRGRPAGSRNKPKPEGWIAPRFQKPEADYC